MLLHKERSSGAISGGVYSFTTNKFSGSLLIALSAVTTTTTTTFDVRILDKDSDIIFEEEGCLGSTLRQLQLPLYGVCTIQIRNSSADETVTIYAYAREGA